MKPLRYTPICTSYSLFGCHFSMDYSELLGIFEGYVIGSLIPGLLIVESASLRAINNLNSCEEDLSKLGALVTYFLDNISLTSASFHVFVAGNIPTHLLEKVALSIDVALAWTINIPFDVA